MSASVLPVERPIEINVLLEEDGAKSGVKSAHSLILEDLSETTNQAVSKARRGNQADTRCLKGAQRDRSKELGAGGRHGVDGGAVLPRLLDAQEVDGLLLEELVAAELEGALDEVAREGRAEARQEGAGALVLDHLPEPADHAAVVRGRVQLDLGLDALADVSEWFYFVWLEADGGSTDTSTGVKAPCVTEQPRAPARAKREYRSMPSGALWVARATGGAAIVTVVKFARQERNKG